MNAITGQAPEADTPVMEVLRGHAAALDAIESVRNGHADPDLLFATLKSVIVVRSEDRLRGFMRTLQKLVERAR